MASPTIPAGFELVQPAKPVPAPAPIVPNEALPAGFEPVIPETAAPVPPPPEEESLLTSLGRTMLQRVESAEEEIGQAPTGQEKLLAGAAQIVKGVGDFTLETASSLMSPSVKEDIKTSIPMAVDLLRSASESDTVEGAGLRAIGAGVEQYQAWKAENPRAARNIENTLTVATGGIGTGLLVKAGKKPFKLISARKSLDVLDNTLQDTVSKNMIQIVGSGGVQRTKGGRATKIVNGKPKNVNLTPLQVFNTRAKNAVESIAERKDILEFTDEVGNVVAKGLPRNVSHFHQAIRNTKDAIFQEYNALARSVNQTVKVPTDKTIANLKKYRDSVVVQDNAPQLIPEIDAEIARLTQRGGYTPIEAQELIADLNAKTRTFQRTGTAGTKNSNDINMIKLDALRSGMDEAVEKGLDQLGKTTNRDYSALKEAYGSLAEIEKGVGTAAKRELAKAGKQTGGLSGIISDHGLMWSIYHMNPKTLAASLSVKQLVRFKKWRKSNDRLTQQMFDRADKLTRRKAEVKTDTPGVQEPQLLLSGPDKPIVTPFEPVTERGFQVVDQPKGINALIPPKTRTSRGPAGQVKSKPAAQDPQFTGDPFIDEKITDALRTPGFQRTAEQRSLIESIRKASTGTESVQ